MTIDRRAVVLVTAAGAARVGDNGCPFLVVQRASGR